MVSDTSVIKKCMTDENEALYSAEKDATRDSTINLLEHDHGSEEVGFKHPSKPNSPKIKEWEYDWDYIFHPKKWDLGHIRSEVLLGIAICFAQVPESVAFAIMGRVAPSVGLHSAWIVGLISAIGGGRPGIINGFTGAFAAVLCQYIAEPDGGIGNGEGIEYAFPAVILAGFGLMFAAWCSLPRFVSLIPASVMIGFCNGLAIIIGLSQLHSFNPDHHWKTGSELGWMIGMAVLAAIIMEGMPRLPHPVFKIFPSSLVAIVVVVILEFLVIRPCGFRTDTIGDLFPFKASTAFPIPFFWDPQFDMSKLSYDFSKIKMTIELAFFRAVITTMETLMTIEAVNGIQRLPSAKLEQQNRQLGVMGFACIVSGFMGGLGGNCMIGLSLIASLNKGKGRIAPIVCAMGVGICTMGAYEILNCIPLSGLVGIMIVVVCHTFKWSSLKLIFQGLMPLKYRKKFGMHSKIQRSDLFIIVGVTIVCVFNVVFGVIGGILFAAVAYAWDSSKQVDYTIIDSPDVDGGTRLYTFSGNLFFGSKRRFLSVFEFESDPDNIEIRLENTTLFDYSSLEAINDAVMRYESYGKKCTVKNINYECSRQIEKAIDLYSSWFNPISAGTESPGDTYRHCVSCCEYCLKHSEYLSKSFT